MGIFMFAETLDWDFKINLREVRARICLDGDVKSCLELRMKDFKENNF